MGYCGTREAVAVLKSHALTETNCWWANSLVYSLSLAGENGEKALKELEKEAEESVQHAIRKLRLGTTAPQDANIEFPPLRNVPALPKTLRELKSNRSNETNFEF